MAVNLSASNLLDAELPAEIAGLLERLAVPAAVLCLEITENHLMSDPVRAHEVLAALRLLGVRIAIDDLPATRRSPTSAPWPSTRSKSTSPS